MTINNTVTAVCPVCSSENLHPFLLLPDFPVYLHAVGAEVEQLSRDLHYSCCGDCGHAFIPNYDQNILEDIYRHHYWGADAENVAYSQRDDFIKVYTKIREQMGLAKANILEIGCSSGQMLTELHNHFLQDSYYGYEPNLANAAVCREHGFTITNNFFTKENAKKDLNQRNGKAFDLIYHRHVIEHIFDFDDFFRGMCIIAVTGTRLLIETPSLEQNLDRQSLDPFHHEHVHVFALSSLATLAARFGWHYQQSVFTELGNMIVVYIYDRINQCNEDISTQSKIMSLPDSKKFSQSICDWQQRLSSAMSGKRLIFWGAGSYCTLIMSLCRAKPERIIDGNPNKTGKQMVGSSISIEYAPQVMDTLIKENDTNIMLVITSSFHTEIQIELNKLGWHGAVIVPSILHEESNKQTRPHNML